MAHFFHPTTKAALTSLSAPKGSTVMIGLWGGGPAGEELVVTTRPEGAFGDAPDPAVKQTRRDRPNWTFIYQIDTGKAGSAIRALAPGGDYAASVKIVAAAAPGMSKPESRKAIVDEARSHVANGHYLWGTAGNTPGSGDGNFGKKSAASIRAYSLDDKTTQRDKVLAVCMAVQPVFDGYNTCAGRCNRYQGTPDLAAYLAARAADASSGKAESAWEGAGPTNLHPRKFYFVNAPQNGGRPVWGESCYGRKHFDCIGLVNYCYAKRFTGGNFAVDIAQVRVASSGFAQVADKSPLADADVVIPKGGNKHIGMVYDAGGGAWKVVQAVQTQDGITDGETFDPGKWDRFRMAGQFLK